MFFRHALKRYKARARKVSAPPLRQAGWDVTRGEALTITVKLFATFRVGRFAASTQRYPEGTLIAEVIRDLRIQEREIGMIMQNGIHVEPGQQLKEGDILSIFPLVGGG